MNQVLSRPKAPWRLWLTRSIIPLLAIGCLGCSSNDGSAPDSGQSEDGQVVTDRGDPCASPDLDCSIARATGQGIDRDGDGWGECCDCDDLNETINPGRPEVQMNCVDEDCNPATPDGDLDGDGYLSANRVCDPGNDCDDTDPSISPGIEEVCYDRIDNNCDGETDLPCSGPCDEAAAARSSVGCVFFPVDTNPSPALNAAEFSVAIMNMDPVRAAWVKVEFREGQIWRSYQHWEFPLEPFQVVTHTLPDRYVEGNTISAGGAYRISSNLPLSVTQFSPMNGSTDYLNDPSLLLPRAALDTHYLIPAWPFGAYDFGFNVGLPTHIQIVAAVDTEVRVKTSIWTQDGPLPTQAPGVWVSHALEEGDFIQLTARDFGDSFAGSQVEADGPVAVFSSNDCVNVPESFWYCGHLEEQIFGLQTWGTEVVAARVPPRVLEPAIWQILAQSDGTTVTFEADPAVTGLPAELNLEAGQVAELTVGGPIDQPGDFLLRANLPVLVVQYSVAASMVTEDFKGGDPNMVQAVHLDQFLRSYVVMVPADWENNSFVLTREAGTWIRRNGTEIQAAWVPVGNSGFEVARIPARGGVWVLAGERPFGAIVVGYDDHDSYAYPGGLGQRIINPL